MDVDRLLHERSFPTFQQQSSNQNKTKEKKTKKKKKQILQYYNMIIDMFIADYYLTSMQIHSTHKQLLPTSLYQH